MDTPSLYAFYGSLRKGQYNFDRLDLAKNADIIGVFTLSHFTMYSVGPYPFITDGPSDSTITVEVMEISDRHTKRWIESMERGAGYEERKIKVDALENVTIYVRTLEKERQSYWPKVEGGDWSHWKKQPLSYEIKIKQ